MELNLNKFSGVDFNPEKYVKEVSQVCVGGLELQQHRAKVQALAEETSAALKKNVYHNYMQFIETAKEISHLESEMYQLSHLLTEQRSLLSTLASSGLTPAAPLESPQQEVKIEDKRENLLATIAEKVEGCASLLDVKDRKLNYEGDLIELDPVENTALHRVHAYLLTDILLIATWISNRRGPARYKLQAQYDLDSLAVVNVRDLGSVRHAFKLLAFPDSRVFQCSNTIAKSEWLEHFEQAKKARTTQEQTKREAITSTSEPFSPVPVGSVESETNPFGEYEDGDGTSLEENPEWLSEVSEDLDVFIAQRHFEEAHSLIEKTKEFLDKAPQTSVNLEIRRKMEQRVTSLINALTSELSVSYDKSLQGGLRAARRSVRLLNQLGRTTQACDLFLRLCTSILKTQLKRVKREGATVMYVKRLGGIFFSNLADMTREFQLRAFPNCPSTASVFVVWASQELSHFTSHLIKQIFMPQTSLTTLAESVQIVRSQCNQLCDLGIDLCYQLDGQLRSPLTRSLLETRDKLVDAVKLRCSEDDWLPSFFEPEALNKLNTELIEFGLPSIMPYSSGDCRLELTNNTVAFTKLYLSLLNDGLRITNEDLSYTLDKIFYDVFSTHLKHIALSLQADRLKPKKFLILKNATFLLDFLLTTCEKKYKDCVGQSSKKLHQLRQEYTFLLAESGTKLSNVTGYI
uniref:Exocyst complex component 8 n=1 Tax=Clastoptera arizonana TaxID=38151 RepID=A0A1B6DF58_9HEMI